VAVPVNYIARWDGSHWSALAGGLEYEVCALAVSGSNLYAGGQFTWATNSGGVAVQANFIARWNGNSWSRLGSEVDSAVWVLAASGCDIYAGGDFLMAGVTEANYIAKWDGTGWSALGSGMDTSVYSLAVSGTNLYAGGEFTTAGGVEARSIAKWNGTGWSALGGGLADNSGSGSVRALALCGSDLYAGGSFTWATNSGGLAVPANFIAKWDGSSWSALGSGLSGGELGYSSVFALAVSGSALYAGGEFTIAGAKVAGYVAKANLGVSVPVAIVTADGTLGFTNGQFGFSVIGPAGSSIVIEASSDLKAWIPLQTNLLGSEPIHFSDPQSAAHDGRYYRAGISP
jgi:hypothetical protein